MSYYNNKSCYDVNLLVKGSTKSSISNLTDALSHYRGGSGKTVPANNTLINEMKNDSSFKNMIKELQTLIRNKINDQKIKNAEKICAAPGSRRGLRCGTLGSYNLNIQYSFIPKYGDNYFDIHFSGYDRWDFEWNKNKNFFHNIANEVLPSVAAGKGTPFNITYDFHHKICVKY